MWFVLKQLETSLIFRRIYIADFIALSEIALKDVSLLIKFAPLANVTEYANLSYSYFV